MGDDSHEALVEIVGSAPHADWMDDFFDLLEELLSKVEPRDDDPRLVTSIVRGDRIAVTMNSRYVLTAYPERPRVGFIIREGSKRTDELIENADGHYSFKALQGEDEGETPHWVAFNGEPKNKLKGEVSQNWLRASDIEFDRWTGSPYKDSHEALARKAATDKEYRRRVLREAFPDE